MNENKIIGDTNQLARAAATRTLAKLKGRKISKMRLKEILLVLTAVVQWLGLADEKGYIK
jgi:hypothetical protein